MTTLSAEQAERLDHWRGKLRNEWRIAEECGLPRTEAGKVWDMVQLEMKFCCPDFMQGMIIAYYATQWVETRNPHFIDGAVYLCALSGIEPSPAIAELVAEVARLRFLGEVRGGTPDQIKRDAAKNMALTLMANLRAAGASLEDSASKAAQFMSDRNSGRPLKSSSLQKFYTAEWRRLEIVLRDNLRLDDDGAHNRTQWQQILAALPSADDDLRGNRRE